MIPATGPSARALGKLADWIARRPRTVVVAASVLALAAVTQAVRVQVTTSRMELGSAGRPWERQFGQFLDEFGSPNDLLAVVDGAPAPELRRATDELAAVLAADPAHVRSTFCKVDLDFFLRHVLLFTPARELERVRQTLDSPFAESLRAGRVSSLDALVDEIAHMFGKLSGAVDAQRAERGLEALRLVIGELRLRLVEPGRSGLGELKQLVPPLASGALDDEGYLQSRDGGLRLVFIRPASRSDENDVVLPLVALLRQRAATVASHHPGVRVRLSGLGALQADETAIVNRDLLVSTVLSLLFIGAICLYGYRKPQQVLLSLVPLMIGAVWTLAFVRLRYGKINLVASAFAPILLGRGSDFAIYLIARYNALRQAGSDVSEAVKESLAGSGGGIITGALVTAAAFLVATRGQFGPFSELGVVVGVGLVLVLIASVLVTPALLLWVGARQLPGEAAAERALERVPPFGRGPGALALRWPGTTLGVTVAVVMVMAAFARKVPFDFDLLKFLPPAAESVTAQRDVSRRSDYGFDVGVVIADGVPEARKLAAELARLPSVGRVESIASFLPDEQPAKLALIAEMKERVASIPPLERPMPPTSRPELHRALERLGDAIDDAQFSAAQAGHPLAAPLAQLATEVKSTDTTLGGLSPDEAGRRIAAVEGETFAALGKLRTLIRDNVLSAQAIDLADLPTATRERFVGRSGKSALYVFPRRAGAGEELTAFVTEVRSVAPGATGFPVIYFESSRSIRRGFLHAAGLALVVIVLALALHFRNLGAVLLALIPLGCGAVIMAGLMHLGGIAHNVANITSLPLLLGLGTDYGLQMVHYRRTHREASLDEVLKKTALGIFIAGGTTSAGFGALIFAIHQGGRSLGLVLFLGTTAALLCTLVVLPAVLALLERWSRPRQ